MPRLGSQPYCIYTELGKELGEDRFLSARGRTELQGVGRKILFAPPPGGSAAGAESKEKGER